jgi:hypothetical protein
MNTRITNVEMLAETLKEGDKWFGGNLKPFVFNKVIYTGPRNSIPYMFEQFKVSTREEALSFIESICEQSNITDNKSLISYELIANSLYDTRITSNNKTINAGNVN